VTGGAPSQSGGAAGFTTRVITTPDRDLVADRVVGPGAYTAVAPLTSAGG